MKINLQTKNITQFLAKTQNTILSAAFILALASGVNAIIGFIKMRLLIQYFGVESPENTMFIIADRIPSLIYSILIVGAVSTVFIPVFAELLKKDEKEAFNTASSMINATFVFFGAIATVIFIFAPQLINLLALGKFSPTEVTTSAGLMRIMLLGQLLLVCGSLLTSVLQSYKYFLVPAIAPILYNLGVVLGTILLSGKLGIYGPAYGVVLGALLHILVQVPVIKLSGFHFKFSLNFADKGFRQMSKLIPPRIASVFLANLIGTVNNSLAILISSASVVYLKSATQLQTFPVNLIGLSMASASLPTLSSESGKDDLQKFKKTFLTSYHQMMFLIMPLSIILLILRVPAVRLVFGVSNFTWDATLETAHALAFYSIAIVTQSANYLLTRAFYALKDTLTPVYVSLATVVANILISIYFVSFLHWGVWSLAASFAITSVLDTLTLWLLLDKKVGGFDRTATLLPFAKITLATFLMGITLYLPIKLLDQIIIDTSHTLNLLLLTGIAGLCGLGTYLFFTRIFQVEEIKLFYALLTKLKLRPAGKDITEPIGQATD